MSGRDDLAALEPVADALEAIGIEYYVGGSVASSVHGVARSTIDIDVVAAVAHEHVQALVARLEDAYYVEAQQIRQAIDTQRAFNLVHLATMYKIDVFVMKHRPFDDQARRRTVMEPLTEESERRFLIASPEDTILSKLEWYRAGGEVSGRQWSDVRGIIRVQSDRLDRPYLREWASRLDVADLLSRAWEEADAPSDPRECE